MTKLTSKIFYTTSAFFDQSAGPNSNSHKHAMLFIPALFITLWWYNVSSFHHILVTQLFFCLVIAVFHDFNLEPVCDSVCLIVSDLVLLVYL